MIDWIYILPFHLPKVAFITKKKFIHKNSKIHHKITIKPQLKQRNINHWLLKAHLKRGLISGSYGTLMWRGLTALYQELVEFQSWGSAKEKTPSLVPTICASRLIVKGTSRLRLSPNDQRGQAELLELNFSPRKNSPVRPLGSGFQQIVPRRKRQTPFWAWYQRRSVLAGHSALALCLFIQAILPSLTKRFQEVAYLEMIASVRRDSFL